MSLTAEALAPFQTRVAPWMAECFGATIASDVRERGDRLLEEVLELLQSHGYDPGRVATLRDYVYGRPVGEPGQEAGGVMVTLAAYCLATGIDMHAAGETELARIWTKVDVIRAKQASKRDIHSPLPTHPAPSPAGQPEGVEATFGAFYTCPTCHGVGVTTKAVHDELRRLASAQPQRTQIVCARPCDCGPQGCGAGHCVMDVIEAAEAEMREAWQLYCKETAGSMDVRDFWEDLPPHVQQMFLDRVRLGYELNTRGRVA